MSGTSKSNSFCSSLFTWLGGALLAFGLVGVGAGCGGSDGPSNPCIDKTCDFGSCNPETGFCNNPSSCEEDIECVPGFECSDDRTCVAINSCEQDSDCDTGVCREGGCVNPESCSSNSDCQPRTYCDTTGGGDEESGDGENGENGENGEGGGAGPGTCEPDPCNDVTCTRGTCQRGTDNCVSKESCTEDTELVDCVAGEKCANGTCAGSEEFCDEITCERGVCSFEEGECVDATECTADEECLEGDFCNEEMGTCQVDLCQANDIDCERGVCQPSSGQCQNAESCEATSDCVADPPHLCVDGTCVLESNACGEAEGDGGCPGNQICAFDEENLSASCQEPEVCETSVDCQGDRRCGGRSCLEPEMCRDDLLEPNDSAGEATVLRDVATLGTVSATVCSGNSDFYQVSTPEFFEVARGGTLVVDIDVPERDRGLGELEVEVVDEAGNSQGTVTTGTEGREASARFTQQLSATDHGTFTIEVRPTGSVGQTGVNYELSVDVLPQDAIDACDESNVETITPSQRVSGTTEETASSEYGSTCTAERNSSNEKIFEMTIDRPQELTFDLDPVVSESDFTMSLRRRCGQGGTEIACKNDGGAGAGEEFTRILGPGTYYLVVQSPEGAPGGAFDLFIDQVFTSCASKGDFCDTDGNANVCTLTGGRRNTVECVNDCNPTEGVCLPPAGNVCQTAETIDPMNAGTRTLNLNQARDEYQAGAGVTCFDAGTPRTGGPDQTFEVKVPSRKFVKLETTFKNEIEGSMYLVDDCSDIEGTCRKAAQSSTEDAGREVLRYSNPSMQNDESFFLIVDTEEEQANLSTAELDITYQNLVCTPGGSSCAMGSETVNVCSDFGLQEFALGSCENACTMGRCDSGTISLDGSNSDTCSNARDITGLISQTGGHEFTGTFGDFTNAYEGDDTCGGSESIDSFDTDGNDMFWKVQLGSDEGIRATFSGADDGFFKDVVLYVKDPADCGVTGTSCKAANQPFSTTATVEYTTQQPETVVLAADREEPFTGGSGDNWTLDANLASTCSPTGTTIGCTGSGSIEQCSSAGLPSTFACAQGCSNSTCAGDSCSNKLDLTSAAQASGGTSVSGDWGAYTSNLNASTCSTLGTIDTDGNEHMYEFTLQDGEMLDASLSGNGDMSLYIKETSDCGSSGATCKDQDEEEGGDTARVDYTNNTGSSETVVLVAEREAETGGSFTLDADIR